MIRIAGSRLPSLGVCALALTCSAVLGQLPPAFEVASLKLSGPQSVRGSQGGPGSTDPGQYSFGQATLRDLIFVAFDLNYPFQISSAANLGEQRFDLIAKVPPGATREQFRTMMRNLLAERFHLKTHIQSKDFPAYALVVAPGGAKLKESDAPAADRPRVSVNYSNSGGFEMVRVRAERATMAVVAKMLWQPGEDPILDNTGLTGRYDFTMDYAAERRGPASPGPAEAAPAPDLPVALRQLGLQLVNRKAPFDVVEIDSADKLPIEN